MIVPELSHSPQTEITLLGCLLLDPSTVTDCGLDPEEFYNPVNRTVYEAIRRLSDTGFEFDAVLVNAELERTGKLQEVGGWDFLSHCCGEAVGPSRATDLARVVRERYLTRKYESVLKDAAQIVNNGTPIDDACKIIKDSLDRLHSKSPGKTRAKIGRLGTFGGRDRRGVSTGLPRLDSLIGHVGGYPNSEMTIVSAYHKTGKTSLMLTSAVKAAQKGRRALFASFADMNGPELEDRVMKGETGWSKCPDYGHQREEWLSIHEDFKTGGARVDVYDAAELATGYDVETFIDWFEARQRREPYTEVYVDYAQELQTRSKTFSMNERATTCASMLQRLAKRHEIPIIVGSQITEGKEGGRDVTKDSRSWEEKAGLVIRLRKTGTAGVLEIPFSRVGPSGEGVRMNLKWNPERVRFEE